jgi:predicted RNA binding protein YcfA (HicA-like mRNA interferase family)
LEVQHVAKASPSIKTLGNKKVDVAAQTTEKAIEVHDVVRHLKNESVRAIMKFFKECGFDLERIHGDHRMLSNPLKQKKCILPGNLGDTVKQGTLRSVVEQSGVCELQQDELKEMIP